MNNTSKNPLMLWVFALITGFCFSPLLAEEEAVKTINSYVVKAGKAHLGNGQTVDNAVIVVREGRI